MYKRLLLFITIAGIYAGVHSLPAQLQRFVGIHNDTAVSAAKTQDGSIVVSGSLDKTMRLWKQHNGGWREWFRQTFYSPVRAVNISADGKRVVCGTDFGHLRIYRVDSDGRLIQEYTFEARQSVRELAINASGTKVALATSEGAVYYIEKTLTGWRKEYVGKCFTAFYYVSRVGITENDTIVTQTQGHGESGDTIEWHRREPNSGTTAWSGEPATAVARSLLECIERERQSIYRGMYGEIHLND